MIRKVYFYETENFKTKYHCSWGLQRGLVLVLLCLPLGLPPCCRDQQTWLQRKCPEHRPASVFTFSRGPLPQRTGCDPIFWYKVSEQNHIKRHLQRMDSSVQSSTVHNPVKFLFITWDAQKLNSFSVLQATLESWLLISCKKWLEQQPTHLLGIINDSQN